MKTIKNIPFELLIKIFKYIKTKKEIFKLILVNKLWYDLNIQRIWEEIKPKNKYELFNLIKLILNKKETYTNPKNLIKTISLNKLITAEEDSTLILLSDCKKLKKIKALEYDNSEFNT